MYMISLWIKGGLHMWRLTSLLTIRSVLGNLCIKRSKKGLMWIYIITEIQINVWGFHIPCFRMSGLLYIDEVILSRFNERINLMTTLSHRVKEQFLQSNKADNLSLVTKFRNKRKIFILWHLLLVNLIIGK